MTTKAWARRLAATAVAALLIPACKATDTPDVLFLDGFDGTYPGTAWNESAATGSATILKDLLHGSGAFPDVPCLRITASSSASSVSTRTTASFANPSVSFSVQMAAKADAGNEGIGSIKIRDNVAVVVASATWNEATDALTVAIGATSFTIASPSADLVFHQLVFRVSSDGTASWALDNGGALVSAAVAAGPLTLELGGDFPSGTTFASFYFDTVTVTTP